ncbi:hypothetical protein D9615_006846 [Tricholomella constricta]|uniref:F-box domain-containing protein n=1 Tax=Tricholomella constricta TaxID=117010 RepID=A0A8H5H8R9_9AGAR|nr:hypothetical protein D9615_006846 [Tricholomella constricta]
MGAGSVPTPVHVALHINQFPTEILFKIFASCVEYDSSEPLHRRAPILLAGICWRWREVAQGIPELWEFLNYDWQLESEARVAERAVLEREMRDRSSNQLNGEVLSGSGIRAIGAWIQHAQQRPLTLILKFSPKTPSKSVTDLFRHHASLTRRLSLKAPLSTFHALTAMIQTAVSRQCARFPTIELVNLAMSQNDSNKAKTRKITSTRNISFSGCAKLRHVQFDSADSSFGFIADNLVSGIPYAQLTNLSITETALHPLRARAILMECVNLKRCYMVISQWSANEITPPSENPVALARLEELLLRFIGSQFGGKVSAFFEPFTVPALTRLTIEARQSFDESLLLVLTQMQMRSRAPIRQLAFMNIALPHYQLPQYLQLLPDLTYLRIEAPVNGMCYSYATLLDAIRYQHDPSAQAPAGDILPNLEEIFIADNLPACFSDGQTGRVAKNLAGRRIDVSKMLKDMEALEAIESRCWRHEDMEAARDARTEEGPVRRGLEVATVQWRNVPQEWCSAKRHAFARRDEIEDLYTVTIHMLLEP